ncbi:MAG TPA: ATP synthase F1 subunit gamma [candidate division Zixibacteria bacterium]|jgi:F-type H+-transporting ATPase subunit gamma
MPSSRDIKRRIRSVKSTQQITKAMEMVSAAKLRKAQMRAEQARPYRGKLELILSNISAAVVRPDQPPPHPFFQARTPVKKSTLILVTADRGLCGSFNAYLIRRALVFLKDYNPANVELICIGKRGYDWFRKRQWPIAAKHLDFGGTIGFARVRAIAADLTARFRSGETDEVHLIYTRFITTARSSVTQSQYLPIKPHEGRADKSSDYIFEPAPAAIFADLMPRYATTLLQSALAESFASEHAARMMAMGAATSAAGDMIDTLTLQYNKARQAAITKELLDIVGGAEALR